MADTHSIHALVGRARRRLRLQAALEWGTLAVVPAATVAAAVVFLLGRETIGHAPGVALLIACGAAPIVAGIAGSMRKFSDQVVATKIDRASGLSDRLATACAFEAELARPPTSASAGTAAKGDLAERDLEEAETRALMRAAIEDAIAAAPRANVKAATPFAWPKDTKAALAFAGAAALVSLLNLAPKDAPLSSLATTDPRGGGELLGVETPQPLAEDDLDYARDLLEEVKAAAEAGDDPAFTALTKKLEQLLSQAERGEISREELLAEMNRAHDEYMKGGDEQMLQESLGDLEKTGKELAKEKLTQEMGRALAEGDLEKAKQEMEKLAEKLANGEVSQKDAKDAAKALERASEAFEKRQAEREKKADDKTKRAEQEVAKAEKQVAEAKTPEKKEEAERRLRKKQEDLKQAKDEQARQQEAEEKRTLKRLHRNMKKAAEQMNQPQDQDQQQENQRQASRTMEDMARDTGKVDADRRKITNQKKVASQLSDLKEALSRAKRGGSRGPQDRFGRNKRNADFQKRARGGQGSKQAWKPGGQGQGQQGQGQGQQGQGQGQGQGGSTYGDGHDPNLLGDSTAKSGNTQDESVSGIHGKGPSIRETILSSAQKGFASQSYKQVYARYKTIVEEVIHAEKVPSGYKYYVKKYFQKIKPHEM